MQPLNVCVLYKLIRFASNCLHSKTHLSYEPNRGSYGESQHASCLCPKEVPGRAEHPGYFHNLREKR